MTFRSYVSATLIALWIGTSAFAQNTTLPMRDAPRPATTNDVPHVQFGVEADADLTAELLRLVAEFPGVSLGETRVSLPGAVGFQLDASLDLARPGVVVGGREFAHLHPDGSLHATLDPDVAKSAVMAGWATPHPWAAQRAGWEGFVMIYTPLNDAEFDVVLQLVEGSYSFVTGNTSP